MQHPYQSLTRNRERHPVRHSTNEPTAVTWIVAAGFIFIIFTVALAPLLMGAR